MDIQKIIHELGFSEYETRILLFLLSHNQVNAKEIAQGSSVPITRIYSILIRLEKDGLISRLPGKIQLFSTVDKKLFLKMLEEKQQKQIFEQKQKLTVMINELGAKLPEIQKGITPSIMVRYFTDSEAYWKVYNEEQAKLKENEMHHIINTIRPTFSFLLEELESVPAYKSMVKKELVKKVYTTHYILNPEAFVERIVNDLKNKEKASKALAQMLNYMSIHKKKFLIDISTALKNILVDIQKESVFLEFYGQDSVHIISAIQIKDSKIANDFRKWFDAFCSKKHDPEKDFKKFRSEIINYASKNGIVIK
jgi:DNA-binding MarR family transcriptional regulator